MELPFARQFSSFVRRSSTSWTAPPAQHEALTVAFGLSIGGLRPNSSSSVGLAVLGLFVQAAEESLSSLLLMTHTIGLDMQRRECLSFVARRLLPEQITLGSPTRQSTLRCGLPSFSSRPLGLWMRVPCWNRSCLRATR